MDPLTGPSNNVTPGKINLVARASWSRRRAWHGEKVKMQLATELVKDDTAVELYVQTEDDVPVEIDKVTGEKVAGGALSKEYEISWKDKPFGDKRMFMLAAKVGEKLDASRSQTLYIDLDPPVFSA